MSLEDAELASPSRGFGTSVDAVCSAGTGGAGAGAV